MKLSKVVVLVIGIFFAFNFGLYAKIQHKKQHQHSKKLSVITIDNKTAIAAENAAKVTPFLTQNLVIELASIRQKLVNATAQLNTNLPQAIVDLENAETRIELAIKNSRIAYDAAFKTSSLLKPLDYAQAEVILQQGIALLYKKIPASYPAIGAAYRELNRIKKEQALQQAAKKKAAKNYVIISNALGLGGIKGRIAIYGALKKNPNVKMRMKGLTIKKNRAVFKIACNPNLVYYIKLIKGKNKESLLKRAGGNGVDYFSDADIHHQIIINNTKRYSVHTIKYKGPGSLYRVKQSQGAIMAAEQIAIFLGTVAVCTLTFGAGSLGMAALDALGISAETAASFGIVETTAVGAALATATNSAVAAVGVGLDVVTLGASTTLAEAIGAAATVTAEAVGAGLSATARAIAEIVGLETAQSLGLATPLATQTAANLTAVEVEALATQAAHTAARYYWLSTANAPSTLSAFSSEAIAGLSAENAVKLAPYMTEAQLAALSTGARSAVIQSGTKVGTQLAAENLARAQVIQAAYDSSFVGRAGATTAQGVRAVGLGGLVPTTSSSAELAVENALAEQAMSRAIMDAKKAQLLIEGEVVPYEERVRIVSQALQSPKLEVFSPWETNLKAVNYYSSLSQAELAQIAPEEAARITAEQLAIMSPEQLGALSSDAQHALLVNRVANAHLSQAQLSRLNAFVQLQSMQPRTTAQVEAADSLAKARAMQQAVAVKNSAVIQGAHLRNNSPVFIPGAIIQLQGSKPTGLMYQQKIKQPSNTINNRPKQAPKNIPH